MAFSIKNEQVDELLRELVALTGESLTDAVRNSLAERIQRTQRQVANAREALQAAAVRCALLPIVCDVRPDDVVSFDSIGLPR